jgi:2-hydroxy-3-keto-5-methylthiopentenyl-1-phosphate phosphatase
VNQVVLCDFDGTIVAIDTAEYALRKFAVGDWKSVEERFERDAITFEECMREQFSMIRASEKAIVAELDKVATVRPNFAELVKYCQSNGVSLVVVSGGLDFYIRHFLSQNGWLKLLDVYAPKASCTGNGIELVFPTLFAARSASFKDDLVRYHRGRGKRVTYIGNGTGDCPAASSADSIFAVKDSALAEFCRKNMIRFKEISDFQEVVEVLKNDR